MQSHPPRAVCRISSKAPTDYRIKAGGKEGASHTSFESPQGESGLLQSGSKSHSWSVPSPTSWITLQTWIVDMGEGIQLTC